MIRVGVLGAAGRMGRLVCAAVLDDPELELVAAVNPSSPAATVGELLGRSGVSVPVSADVQLLADTGAEVGIDFTTPGAVIGNVIRLLEHGIHAVVGTSGITDEGIRAVEEARLATGGRANVVIVSNFAIGAVLMQRFAAEAARYMPAAEIVELHHDGKLDAPSGTALATAERMAIARGREWGGPRGESVTGARGGESHGVRIHSIRLPGLVAHQEVLFGATGQTLTIRHDSTSRDSFMPGVLLAVKSVLDRPGLTLGLEPILGLDPLPEP